MGRIGRAVAQRARGFEMRVLYHNRTPAAGRRWKRERSMSRAWTALLPRCDIVSLHLPGGAGADGMMDRAAFARMKPGAVFVNTARGSLVDEDALVEALRSGHLFAAGLDVYRRRARRRPAAGRAAECLPDPACRQRHRRDARRDGHAGP